MHTIVNHLPIAPGSDWSEMTRLFDEMAGMAKADHPEVLMIQLVRMAEDAATMLVTFQSEEDMKTFSSTVAGPWFAANFRRFLAGPADRRTGEAVSAFMR